RFTAAVGGRIETIIRTNQERPVRAFGEMVDVLWKQNLASAALRLEELWVDLIAKHGFSLLCAYAMDNFYREADAGDFQRVCGAHDHVQLADGVSALRDALAERRKAEVVSRHFH